MDATDLDVITEEALRLGSSCDLHYFDALTGPQRGMYLRLSTVYRAFLNKYAAFMGVGKYDLALAKSPVAVEPVPGQARDFYQRYANCQLRYYHVANNTYIERLTPDELRFLRDRAQEQNYSLDLDSLHFTEDTYRRVILEVAGGQGAAGADSGEDATGAGEPDELPRDALVIGCRVAMGQGREAVQQLLECNALLRDVLSERLAAPTAVEIR